MKDEMLRELGELLDKINPHGGTNPHGNCTSCAIITARLLVDNDEITEKIGACVWNPVKFYEVVHEVPAGPERARRVWNWLGEFARPGQVYIFNDKDHTFNIVRDRDGALHLIDSNTQNYRTLTRPGDCEGRVHAAGKGYIQYNWLGPGQGDLNICHVGPLHKDTPWTAMPFRPRAASGPKAAPMPQAGLKVPEGKDGVR